MRTTSWGHWLALNRVTVLGARFLNRGTASAPVSVLAGPDSGFTINVDPRATMFSRLAHPESLAILDPCISRQPIPFDLDATGTQDFTCLGATVFAPRPGEGAARELQGVRPIRAPPFGRPDDIHVAPEAVDDPRPARPPQWWTFLIPVGIGVVLAVVTGMWWFLLFSASAPLSGYVAFLMERKRFTRESHQCDLDRQAATDRARARLAELMTLHRQQAFAASGLTLGFGAVLSDITVADVLHDDIDQSQGRVILNQVPIRVDPSTTAVTVSGETDLLRTMALAWLADPGCDGLADPTVDWLLGPESARWPELEGTRFAAEQMPPADSSGHGPLGGHAASPRIRIHMDDTTSPAHLYLESPKAESSVSLTLGSLAQARTVSSTARNGPVPSRTLVATLMPSGRFITVARQQHRASTLPPWPAHGLGELCDDDPAAILHRWRSPAPGPVIIGRGTAGDIGIDLFDDGPHALVAGTTGSGKSLLLQTWLLGMALAHPPQHLRFVLIDFKGGATFAPLEDLPHTDSVLDDFDSAQAFRALVSVRAEITRRERLLAHHGRADVLDLADPPPRLVIVIDEFHALMATHPKAAELLEHLTALGRSLGVHLILATQRPLGVVTGQMKANINIRVCLRVREETDSFDVIGLDSAAHLPTDKPGAACLDSGSSACRFRVAVPLAEDTVAEVVHRPRLRPWAPGWETSTRRPLNGIRVGNISTAARGQVETAVPRQVVLPPLPTLSEVRGGPGIGPDGGTGIGEATGIIDIPNHQRQMTWSYSPDADGSTIIVGGSQDEADSVLARMADSAARTHRIVALGRITSTVSGAEITCGMEAGWRLQAILDHLVIGSGDGRRPPTLVVCGNWAEFIDSLDHHWADQMDRLLKHGQASGLTFLLAGCRNSMAATSLFSTQIIFPPRPGGDGLSVGLSRQRFLGDWPDFRAVILGPFVRDAGADGADVQLISHDFLPADSGHRPDPGHRHDCAPRLGFEPCWKGLGPSTRGFEPLQTSTTATDQSSPLCLGVDAFGELVTWVPVHDGPVLTVRGSAQSGKTEVAAMIGRQSARREGSSADPASSQPILSLHDDAHLESDPVALDLLDGGLHLITMPVRFSPGYGSPLSKAHELGPLLVLGTHSRQDLANLGLLRLAPLDGEPGTAWFVTETRARPIRLFPAASLARAATAPGGTAPDNIELAQEISAGGPASVS